LEFSTITDAIDPSVTITESLARLFQHTSKNPSDYTDITQIHRMSGTAKDTANSGIGEGARASIGSEGAAANANTTTPFFSPPGTDLRMDSGDACSLGCLPELQCSTCLSEKLRLVVYSILYSSVLYGGSLLLDSLGAHL